ncbi:MAG: shikimate kinase [Thermodesulfobacteriota bacterium]|nr:shikimate kinase [Thermodesulfobacteriota bacterium]
MTKNNIILIGMPGAGKSTVGVILAKRIGFHFIDTDLLIQSQEKSRLQQIIDSQGLENFRKIEEQMLLSLHTEQSVIATGGSVVYSEKGLEVLGKTGLLIYIQVSLTGLQKRIADMGQRGLVMAKEQTFEQLYQERTPLYKKFAKLTISGEGINAEQVAATVEKEINQIWPELTL